MIIPNGSCPHLNPHSADTRLVVDKEIIGYRVPVSVVVEYKGDLVRPKIEFCTSKLVGDSDITCQYAVCPSPEYVSGARFIFCNMITVYKRQLDKHISIDSFLDENLRSISLKDAEFRTFYCNQIRQIVNNRLTQIRKINPDASSRYGKPDSIIFDYDVFHVEPIVQESEPYYHTTFNH